MITTYIKFLECFYEIRIIVRYFDARCAKQIRVGPQFNKGIVDEKN